MCIFKCYTSTSHFYFNTTASTEIYTLSLHDALPISRADHVEARRADRTRRRGAGARRIARSGQAGQARAQRRPAARGGQDRKSTRLNSSHSSISYAVFCLKKKNMSRSERITCNKGLG